MLLFFDTLINITGLTYLPICVGFGGFVPRVQNQLGLTYARATHEALNEFTDALMGVGLEDYSDCYDTGATAARARQCPPKAIHDERSCHTGCSLEPPKRCPM